MNANEANTTAKRVAGGIIIGGKKKQKKRKVVAAASASIASSSVPSILKSAPPQIANQNATTSSPPNVAAADNDDEFSELLMSNNDEIPSDTLLCLQSYTQSTMGMTAESCAYCPIFANSKLEGGQINKVCTHLAPFLPKSVLLHILDTDSSSSSSRMQIEQEIKSLASENKIRLLQLQGTAITTTDSKPSTSSSAFKTSKATITKFSNSGVTGLRGDGNDDDDIAIMEILAFEMAVKMALESHATTLGLEQRQTFDITAIHDWFLKQLLPQFAGKTWISSSNLNSFIQDNKVKDYWSVDRMSKLVHELTLAGLFLPRRGLGGSRMEGYWFSLPGLGKVSKSIADGRVAILRKLKSCKYHEKKRAILEREHGLFRDGSDDISKASSWGTSKKSRSIQQSGRFVVLDLLAKGLVILKTTSAGEHFIALPKN